MSDTHKPETPPTTPNPTPLPEPKPAPPPALQPEQVYGSGPRLRDLDADIERELQEAMAGMSDKDMYGEPERRRGRQAAGTAPARKKGRVLSVHGADVFVEVPGGRSQGVLP